jgi:hypothetical protein
MSFRSRRSRGQEYEEIMRMGMNGRSEVSVEKGVVMGKCG